MSAPNSKVQRFYYSRRQFDHLASFSHRFLFGDCGLVRPHYEPQFAWINGEIVPYTEAAPIRQTWKHLTAHNECYADSRYLGIGVDLQEAIDELIDEMEKHFT